jgi:hypothetical protein
VQYRDWRNRIGEFGRRSKVIEEVTKRLNSDLKYLFVLRSVARRRLEEAENSSTCAAVN